MAANYAILIGVSGYDETIGQPDLRGPSNDVALMQNVLAAHEFDITLLSEGVPGGTRPSRNVIMTALDDLAGSVTKGDFVYLHFSGFGSQQPDVNGKAWENVFLPADTGRAVAGNTEIPNAILETEINTGIIAMRQKGADVWFVRDTCHASPSPQVGSSRVALRCVDPSVLGLDGLKALTKRAGAHSDYSSNASGRLVSFLASHPAEPAREVQIDTSDPASWYGILTSRLASRLQSGPAASYRELFQAIVSDLDDTVLPGAARLQTPQWEGNLIDEAPFRGSGPVEPRQFPISGDQLQAGQLQGLRDNMIVALFPDTSAKADEILGHAQLFRTGLQSTYLMGITGPCVAQVSAPCSNIGPLVEGAAFARVVATPLDPIVRIAPPVDFATGQPLDTADPLYAMLEMAMMSSDAEEGLAFSFEPDAKILSAAHDGALWFGERLNTLTAPMGLRWSPQGGPVQFVLRRIAMAEKLAGLLTNLSDRTPSLAPGPVDVRVMRQASEAVPPAEGTVDEQGAKCVPFLQNASVGVVPLSGAQDQDCDPLRFIAQVTTEGPAHDINSVYIDSQYCISVRHQRLGSMTQAVDLDVPVTFCPNCSYEDAVVQKAGTERLFILVSEPSAGSEALNLEGIVDTCLLEGAAAIPGSLPRKDDDFLTGLAQQDSTEDKLESAGVTRLWVKAFRWQVLPGGKALWLADQ